MLLIFCIDYFVSCNFNNGQLGVTIYFISITKKKPLSNQKTYLPNHWTLTDHLNSHHTNQYKKQTNKNKIVFITDLQ